MRREESERIAYTIWRTCTKCMYADIDFMEAIADDVEIIGHVRALKVWAAMLAPVRYLADENGVSVIFG